MRWNPVCLVVLLALPVAADAEPQGSSRGITGAPNLVCDYWNRIDLAAWDAEMDRMFQTFQGIEITKDEVEAAWQMDYERAKARWPGNNRQALSTTRPRRTLRIFLRKEKYNARHSAELADDEVRAYQRLSRNRPEEEIRRMSDLSLKVNLARYSACSCSCDEQKMKEICTNGVYYFYEMSNTYVPKRWRRDACFDESLLPDGVMEP